MEETSYFECGCQSDEHTIRWHRDDYGEGDQWLIISVQLKRHGFFKRLWTAIKYIVGYECRYGHRDEFMVSPDVAHDMRDMLDRHISSISVNNSKTDSE